MRTIQRAFDRRTGASALLAALLLLAGVGVPARAVAAEESALSKAGRGLAGMTCGFLELPGNMVAESRRRGPAYGVPLGFAKGLGGIVVRELVGVYEFVTAPLEVPGDFQPILHPEYPWGYFEESRVADDRYPIGSPDLVAREGKGSRPPAPLN